MSSKLAYQSAIGMEIQDNSIYLTQLVDTDEGPKITAHKTVNIPPKTIINGEITDLNTLVEQVQRALSDNQFNSTNIVACFNDTEYFKRVSKFPKLKSSALTEEIEQKVADHFSYTNDEFQIGSQTSKILEKQDGKNYISALYAASKSSRIESLQALITELDMNLVAVDLAPLASARAILWSQKYVEDTILLVLIEDVFIDFSIVVQGDILYTYSVRKPTKNLLQDPFFTEDLCSKAHQVILTFLNTYTDMDAPTTAVVYDRVDARKFIQEFKTSFEGTVIEYQTQENISLDPSLILEKHTTLNDILPSIGLGLKFFEKVNTTLSLTRLQKQLSPIFNRKHVLVSAGVLGIVIAVYIGIGAIISKQERNIGRELEVVKQQMQSVQTGEFLTGQKQLEQYQDLIKTYENLRHTPYLRAQFINTIIPFMPDDIVLSSFSMTKTQEIKFKASAYYQDSIYKLYTELRKRYFNVKLTGVITRYKETEAPINEFEISFEWR